MVTQIKSKGFGCDQTPLSNTGLDSQLLSGKSLSVRVDWLQGTIRFRALEELHEVIHFIEGYTKEKFVLHPDRGRFVGKQWSNQAQGIEGCMVLYNLPEQEPDELGHAFFSFTATVLSGIDVRDVWRMASGLVGCWGFKATRFDIALDDYLKTVGYYELNCAARRRNFTHFRNMPKVHHTYDEYGNVAGWTITWGGRSGDRMLRCYDKDFESKGKIKANRFELELHDKLAEKALADWLSLDAESFEETSPIVLGGIVIGAIDFVERGHDKNVSRMPVLSWWQEFKDRVGMAIRHTVEAPVTSYERKREWFTRQVSVTLLMFKKVMGNQVFRQYLSRELEQAEERFDSTHSAFVEVYGRGGEPIEFDWHVCNE